MKSFIAFLLLVVFQASAYAESQEVDKDTLKEIYEFCFSLQDTGAPKDKELLECINEELMYGDYKQFKSLSDVKAATEIK